MIPAKSAPLPPVACLLESDISRQSCWRSFYSQTKKQIAPSFMQVTVTVLGLVEERGGGMYQDSPLCAIRSTDNFFALRVSVPVTCYMKHLARASIFSGLAASGTRDTHRAGFYSMPQISNFG